MTHYSDERKDAILKKLLPPYNKSVAELAKEEGIGESTLYKWRDQAKQQGKAVPGKVKTSEHWPAEAKLATLVEVATLNELELGEYCRSKGLYPEQISSWKQSFISGQANNTLQHKALAEQMRQDKKKIQALEKELARKDKALAEAAALLILQKKFEALFYREGEDAMLA